MLVSSLLEKAPPCNSFYWAACTQTPNPSKLWESNNSNKIFNFTRKRTIEPSLSPRQRCICYSTEREAVLKFSSSSRALEVPEVIRRHTCYCSNLLSHHLFKKWPEFTSQGDHQLGGQRDCKLGCDLCFINPPTPSPTDLHWCAFSNYAGQSPPRFKSLNKNHNQQRHEQLSLLQKNWINR